jgi:hypothetical protein
MNTNELDRSLEEVIGNGPPMGAVETQVRQGRLALRRRRLRVGGLAGAAVLATGAVGLSAVHSPGVGRDRIDVRDRFDVSAAPVLSSLPASDAEIIEQCLAQTPESRAQKPPKDKEPGDQTVASEVPAVASEVPLDRLLAAGEPRLVTHAAAGEQLSAVLVSPDKDYWGVCHLEVDPDRDERELNVGTFVVERPDAHDTPGKVDLLYDGNPFGTFVSGPADECYYERRGAIRLKPNCDGMHFSVVDRAPEGVATAELTLATGAVVTVEVVEGVYVVEHEFPISAKRREDLVGLAITGLVFRDETGAIVPNEYFQ